MSLAQLGGGGEPCALCGKRVYPAERVRTTTENVFHRECESCII